MDAQYSRFLLSTVGTLCWWKRTVWGAAELWESLETRGSVEQRSWTRLHCLSCQIMCCTLSWHVAPPTHPTPPLFFLTRLLLCYSTRYIRQEYMRITGILWEEGAVQPAASPHDRLLGDVWWAPPSPHARELTAASECRRRRTSPLHLLSDTFPFT